MLSQVLRTQPCFSRGRTDACKGSAEEGRVCSPSPFIPKKGTWLGPGRACRLFPGALPLSQENQTAQPWHPAIIWAAAPSLFPLLLSSWSMPELCFPRATRAARLPAGVARRRGCPGPAQPGISPAGWQGLPMRVLNAHFAEVSPNFFSR